ncbi:MAG: hypothetical protein QM758_06315 [Armatimonas sp.]
MANGVPVILDIGLERPQDQEDETNLTAWANYRSSLERLKDVGHAWLVIGFRMMYDPDEDRWPLPECNTDEHQRIDIQELPSRFVVHDQLEGPYYRVYANKLLRRAWIEKEEQKNEETGKLEEVGPGIRFLAVLPEHTAIGVQQVRERAYYEASQLDGKIWQQYIEKELRFSLPPDPRLWYEDAQYVVRLLRAREVEQRYLGSPTRKNPSRTPDKKLTDARNALRNAMDACKVPIRSRSSESDPATPPAQEEAPIGWWWAVEVRHPRSESTTDARRRRAAPAMVCFWPINAGTRNEQRELLVSLVPPARIQYKKTIGEHVEMELITKAETVLYNWFADDADGGNGEPT